MHAEDNSEGSHADLGPTTVMLCRNQIRQTQGTLEDSGGAKMGDIMGDVQEEFTFEVLQRKNRMSVTSISCSALTGNIDELSGFVRRCLPA